MYVLYSYAKRKELHPGATVYITVFRTMPPAYPQELGNWRVNITAVEKQKRYYEVTFEYDGSTYVTTWTQGVILKSRGHIYSKNGEQLD